MAAQKRKKVLVSGCFDLLHSGHVKFFEEASKLGDLYVCLGTDENIQMLKNHSTMFPNKERLYMIQSIKYVHHVRFSTGTGDTDFEPDLDDIKPDIFYVNEDGDRQGKRKIIKKRPWIEYVVAKRTPEQGLKARSSTALKAQLKDMANKKQKKQETKEPEDPVTQFKRVVTDKLLEIKQDVINMANNQRKQPHTKQQSDYDEQFRQFKRQVTQKLLEIKQDVVEDKKKQQRAEKEMKEFQQTVVEKLMEIRQQVEELESSKTEEKETKEETKDDRKDNLDDDKKFPWRLCIAGGWLDQPWVSKVMRGGVIVLNVDYNSKFRDRAGLATSTRKVALRLWKNGRPPNNMDNIEIAKLLFGAENPPGTKYVSGSQDHLGLLLPGLNRLDYKGEYWPNRILSMEEDAKQRGKNIKEIYNFIEKVLWLVPVRERKDGYDPLIKKNLTENNVEKLADASDKVWRAILNCDAEDFGVGLTETLKAWKLILPNTVPDSLDSIWQKYDKENYGCLFTGCGGGFLMVVSNKKPHENAFQVKINLKDWWRQ